MLMVPEGGLGDFLFQGSLQYLFQVLSAAGGFFDVVLIDKNSQGVGAAFEAI